MEEKINLVEPLGVSAAIESSRLLAKVAGKLGKKNVLDLGTGTGYIAIYLARCGAQVAAVDISARAVEVAQENARRNNVDISVFQSNLFENVSGFFDLIVWNAPVGDASGRRSIDFLKSLVRRLPLVYELAQAVSYRLFLKERTELDKKVIVESFQHLAEDGLLLLLVIDGEENILSTFAQSIGYKVEMIESSPLRRTIKGNFLLLKK